MGLRYMLSYIFLLLTIRNVLAYPCVGAYGRISYYYGTFCCDYYEEIDGKCKACARGFTSILGRMCHPCPNPTYGHLCARICHCDESQRCHNVYGCIKDSGKPQTEIFRTTQDDSPTTMTLTTGRTVLTYRVKTTSSMNAYLDDSPTTMTVTTERTDLTCLGMIKREVFIYSLVGFSTFLILCFSIGCFCVHKKYHKAFLHRHSEIDQNIGVNNRIYEVDNNVGISQHVLRESAHSNEYVDMQDMQ